MIKFETENLEHKLVYVVNILSCGNLIVIEDGKRKKVFIGKNLNIFLKKSTMGVVRFNTPQKMCLLQYNDCILAIETIPYRIPLSVRGEFLKNFTFSIPKNITFLKSLTYFKENKCFIDGDFIYHHPSNGKEKVLGDGISTSNVTGFSIKEISNSGNMTYLYWSIVERLKNEGTNYSKESAEKQFISALFCKYRKVISLSITDPVTGGCIKVQSPTITNQSFFSNLKNSEQYAVFREKRLVSVYFYRECLDIIGSVYGHKKTRELDVLTVLTSLNVTTLYDIPTKIQKTLPTKFSFQYITGLILRFAGNETDISNMVQMRKLFSLLTSNGMIYHDILEAKENVLNAKKMRDKQLVEKEYVFSKRSEVKINFEDYLSINPMISGSF
jgi:hypothetical protein